MSVRREACAAVESWQALRGWQIIVTLGSEYRNVWGLYLSLRAAHCEVAKLRVLGVTGRIERVEVAS